MGILEPLPIFTYSSPV